MATAYRIVPRLRVGPVRNLGERDRGSVLLTGYHRAGGELDGGIHVGGVNGRGGTEHRATEDGETVEIGRKTVARKIGERARTIARGNSGERRGIEVVEERRENDNGETR